MPKQKALKRSHKPRTRKQPAAWKPFSEQQLRETLLIADLQLDAARLKVLRRVINAEIEAVDRERLGMARTSPRGMAGNARNLHTAAARLGKKLTKPGMGIALAHQFDKAHGLQGEPVKLPDDSVVDFMLNRVEGASATPVAKSAVDVICGYVRWLEGAALAIEAEAKSRAADGLNLKDFMTLYRFDLVWRLSDWFASTVGAPTPKTRESKWCRFLAAAMSHIEGRPLTSGRAYDLWLEVHQGLASWRRKPRSNLAP